VDITDFFMEIILLNAIIMDGKPRESQNEEWKESQEKNSLNKSLYRERVGKLGKWIKAEDPNGKWPKGYFSYCPLIFPKDTSNEALMRL